MFEQGLFKRKPKRKIPPVVTGVGVAAATAVAAAGGWILYSKFVIDHEMPLPPAIESSRSAFTSERAGGISYYFDREGEGRPLVLIHSVNAAASAIEMSPLFQHYRGVRPVFALDLPGFGFSERSNRTYSPELYANAILDFLNMQEQEAADVVALSLSGEFAARASLIAPDLFHSLTLISPTGLTRPESGRASQRAGMAGQGERIKKFLSVPLWEQPLFDLITSRRSIETFLNQSFYGPLPPELVEYAYLTSHQPGARYAPLHFISGSLFTPEVRTKIYEKMTVPTLVLYDRDPFTGFEMLPDVIARNEHWTAVRVPNTCGLPHWDQQSRTYEELEAFWSVVRTLA